MWIVSCFYILLLKAKKTMKTKKKINNLALRNSKIVIFKCGNGIKEHRPMTIVNGKEIIPWQNFHYLDYKPQEASHANCV